MAWSQFYGTIAGRAASEAARCGTKDSGLKIFAASKTGAVKVELYHFDGRDCFIIRLVEHGDSRFDDIPLVTGTFVPGEGSPILRLDDKQVRAHVEREALKAMTKEG